MKTCEKCGKEYTVSFQDKTIRKMVALNAKLFPALKGIVDTAEKYCNECWKETVQPAAESLLGAAKEAQAKT